MVAPLNYLRNHGLILAALLLATLLVYVNGLGNPFIPDDRYIIFKNFQYSQGWKVQDLFQRSLFSTPPSESSYFRPLTLLTFGLNHLLAGEDPKGYRAVNLLLHLLVIFLITVLLSPLTGRWKALFSAALFAVHPVNVQAVSYISSRSDPLYTVFALLCLLSWRNGNEASGKRRTLYLGCALGAFFLGLFAKENIVVVPLLAVTMGLYWNREGTMAKELRRNLGWYLGFLLLFCVYLLLRLGAGFPLSMEGEMTIDFGERPLLALKLFSLYFALAFYPAHLFLFRTILVPQTFFDWQVILGALLLGALAILIYLFWSIRREVSFGILWFLISILPVLNLTILNAPMMEHWLYFPLIGLSLAFVGGVRTLAERAGEIRGAALGLALITLLLSARTIARNAEWKNLVSLFAQNVASYPKHPKAWLWLADSLVKQDRWHEAIRAYQASLAINPYQNTASVDLAEALTRVERSDEAEKVLLQAVWDRPRDPWLLYMLGIHRLKVGNNLQAIEATEKSIDVAPSTGAYHVLGSAYLRLGQKEKAERAFHKALLTYPGEPRFHAEIHLYLGRLYLIQRKYREAQQEWRLALHFDPYHPEARKLLEKQPES